jgi:NAD(P)-dependent dehydrogenase (short-subunit alcohol dehydrogenase family)
MSTVLITGTSTGIGLATALTVARAGHKVYATMRNPARAPELAKTSSQERLPVKIVPMDVDSDESVEDAFLFILKDASHVDVLVNNAGIERNSSVEETPLSDFRAVMETNYFGAIRCIQALIPHMRQRKSGCIINVASVAGHIANPPFAAYTASKFALESLSEVLAGEMKMFNVRVAIVEPGITETPMARAIEAKPDSPIYPQGRRLGNLFAAALKNAATPSVVADKIREIIESGTWTLRHPTGADAIPLLDWRKGMTDEEWVALNAADDDTWYAEVERTFKLEVRPKGRSATEG